MRSSISAASPRSIGSRHGTTAPPSAPSTTSVSTRCTTSLPAPRGAVLFATALVMVLAAALASGAAHAQINPVPQSTSATASSPRVASEAFERARALLAENRRDEALKLIEQALEHTPSDVQLRFQRGVLLTQMGRGDEAITIFTELTRQFPELPEPYNNLAALHAQRGELDAAHAALEEALRAFPAYSLARENLGDVQLRLAERSYQRALEADAGNQAVREKLERTREFLTRVAPAAAAGPSPTAPTASR